MDDEKTRLLFLPRVIAASADVRGGKRLVHYTSGEAAYRIVVGAQVWLRSAHLMNDYSELRHGLTCLQQAWSSNAGLRLGGWLDEKRPGFRGRLEQLFNEHADDMLEHTYILSLSEHEDDEDYLGRLSMWRAYGSQSGVALVLNTQAMLSDTSAMGVFSSPVIYEDTDTYVAWFAEWVDTLIDNEAHLLGMEEQSLLAYFFLAFRITVLATKHPGFREEKEWRVVYSPKIDEASEWVRLETEIIGGVPQPVVKLLLKDNPDLGVEGVHPQGLINRVIIGPCENPLPIRNALCGALESAGIEAPHDKIWMSFMPLRVR